MAVSGAMVVHDSTRRNASTVTSSGLPSGMGGWTLKKKMWLTLALMWLVMIGSVVSMAWEGLSRSRQPGRRGRLPELPFATQRRR